MKHIVKITVEAITEEEYKIDFEQTLEGQHSPQELAVRIKYVTDRIKELLIRSTKESIEEAINKTKYN